MPSQTELLTADSSVRLQLVPCTTEAFTGNSNVPNALPTGLQTEKAIVPYKPKGSNASLNKALTKTITNVERRVSSVRSSFVVVERLIDDPALQICHGRQFSDHAALLKEWEDIKTAFVDVLRSSRKVATDGATMIEEFISTVIPYLRGDGDIGKKQGELRAYRMGLKAGSDCADMFANDLRKVSDRVLDFRRKWGAYSGDTVRRLCSEIDKLQSDIAAAEKSFDETKANFASFLGRAWFEDENPQSAKVTKGLRGLLKEAKNASKVQKKTEDKVSKQASEIQGNTESLVAVWKLLHDDINAIETQMKFSENSTIHEVFKQRVDGLTDQYKHLEKSLQMYGVAMAVVDTTPVAATGGFWRKLVGK